MEKIIHRAATRGFAEHGWLKSWHTFSFSDYYNPSRIHFGMLRVLNDDIIAGGEGFGTHPHDNMEIVTIPLEGALMHRDSMGHAEQLGVGQVQVMTAGTGLTHSEYNADAEKPVKLLQIWVLSDARGHTPRYAEVTLTPAHDNALRLIVAPEGRGSEHVGWIHQDAWFYTLRLKGRQAVNYRFNTPGNGLYLFVIEGRCEAAGERLERRDGMGITGVNELIVAADEYAEVLLMEVPMR